MTYTGKGGRQYNLPDDYVAKGGEGRIYEVINESDLVAKILDKEKILSDNAKSIAKERKLAHMVTYPPSEQLRKQITWPTDVLCDRGRFIGFTMRKMEISEDLNVIYEPPGDTQSYKDITYRHKIIIALNLCAILDFIHSEGYICGDFNPKNISVDPYRGYITILDTDSFHIQANGETHRCDVGLPEYLAPEVQRKMHGSKKNSASPLAEAPLPTFTHDSDNFALAIHIFQLLMNGTHPFACKPLPSQSSVTNPMPDENILRGETPFFTNVPGKTIPPYAPQADCLPDELQKLFKLAFVDGYGNPGKRPDAGTWHSALNNLLNNLEQCPADANHQYYNRLSACPLCEADRRYSLTMAQNSGQRISQIAYSAGPAVRAPASPAHASRRYRKAYVPSSARRRLSLKPAIIANLVWVFVVCMFCMSFADAITESPIGILTLLPGPLLPISAVVAFLVNIRTIYVFLSTRFPRFRNTKTSLKLTIVSVPLLLLIHITISGVIFSLWSEVINHWDLQKDSPNEAVVVQPAEEEEEDVVLPPTDLNLPIFAKNNTFASPSKGEYYRIAPDGTLQKYTRQTKEWEDIDAGVRSIELTGGAVFYIKNDNTLWGYGRNTNGFLGDGTGVDREEPVMILGDVAKLYGKDDLFSVGTVNDRTIVYALTTDKTLWKWGNGDFSPVIAGRDIVDIIGWDISGYSSFYAHNSLGTVTHFSDGRVQKSLQFSVYDMIGTLGGDVTADALDYGVNGYYIDENRTLYRSDWERVGWGSEYEEVKTEIDSNVEAVFTVETRSSSSRHLFYIKTDGSLWGMGQNKSGELGVGTKVPNTDAPVRVAGNVEKVGCYNYLTKDGQLWVWDKDDPTPTLLYEDVADVAYKYISFRDNNIYMVQLQDGTLIDKSNLYSTESFEGVALPETLVFP